VKYTELDVLDVIDIGESDATDLLLSAAPDADKKFKAATKKLNDLLVEVQKTFPDANYYSANGSLCLRLGGSHGGGNAGVAQQELVALSTNTPDIGGGDW